jgi:hypothetical protein
LRFMWFSARAVKCSLEAGASTVTVALLANKAVSFQARLKDG